MAEKFTADIQNKPKRKRRTKEEIAAEKEAARCRCSASCTIPRKELKPEHQTDDSFCLCPDYDRRGGSYKCPIKGDSICGHIHAYRVQNFVAPDGSPLKDFQLKNIEITEDSITMICGPKSGNASSKPPEAPKQAAIEPKGIQTPKARPARQIKVNGVVLAPKIEPAAVKETKPEEIQIVLVLDGDFKTTMHSCLCEEKQAKADFRFACEHMRDLRDKTLAGEFSR